MGTYRLLILGEVFEIGTTDRTDGIDYINIVDIRDGWTDQQFEAVKPFEIRAVEVLGPESVLAAVDYSGLVRWNTQDMYGTDWAYKMAPPKYISGGPADRALTVDFNGMSIVLMNTQSGLPVISSRLSEPAIGKPVWNNGHFYIPVEGAIVGLDLALKEAFRMEALGIDTSAEIIFSGDGIFVVDSDSLIKITR